MNSSCSPGSVPRPGALILALAGSLAACGAVPLAPASPSLADVRLDPRLLSFPQPPAGDEVSSAEDAEEDSGFWLASEPGLYLETSAHPAVLLWADQDPHEPGHGIELEGDLGIGDGYGVAAGVYGGDTGLGLLYLTSTHTELDTDEEARFHAAFVEARVRSEESFGWARGTMTLGLGLGAGGLEYAGPFEDSVGTALEGRLLLGLQIGPLGIDLGGGGFSWGVPGETIGNGAYLAAGLTLSL